MTKREIERLAEKLHRLAYQLEHDAERLRKSGHLYAGAVAKLAQTAGNIARGMK